MYILQSPAKTRLTVDDWRFNGLCVGLVPTMGALHEGHLSLVRAAVSECDRTICSIFVNPTQFGEGEDFDDYPRRLREDADRLEGVGADLVFAPNETDMYEPGYCTYVVQEDLTERLCGARRPGHFRGVCTVVTKLFNICIPDRAYFGRKDFQQTVVLRRMVRDLNIPVEISVMPTVRESDGLAVSSRNEYLSDSERAQALCLYEALRTARQMFQSGQTAPAPIIEKMRGIIENNPDARIDYIEIVSPDDVRPVEQVTEESVAVLAVHVGETRLIDNMPFGDLTDIHKS
jgi:pantoate--beta-alanine ligase